MLSVIVLAALLPLRQEIPCHRWQLRWWSQLLLLLVLPSDEGWLDLGPCSCSFNLKNSRNYYYSKSQMLSLGLSRSCIRNCQRCITWLILKIRPGSFQFCRHIVRHSAGTFEVYFISGASGWHAKTVKMTGHAKHHSKFSSCLISSLKKCYHC